MANQAEYTETLCIVETTFPHLKNNINQNEANVAFTCHCNMLFDSAGSVLYFIDMKLKIDFNKTMLFFRGL